MNGESVAKYCHLIHIICLVYIISSYIRIYWYVEYSIQSFLCDVSIAKTMISPYIWKIPEAAIVKPILIRRMK